MKLYVLDHGTEILDKSCLVAKWNKATRDNVNPDIVWAEIPIHTFLIDHPQGYVLFDTGCDPDFAVNWPPEIEDVSPYRVTEEQHVLARLRQLGVAPEDIKYVIISHLHVDHAGCLKFFRNARVFVNDAEFTTTVRQYALGQGLNVHVPEDIRGFIEAKLNWRLVAENEVEVEVVPGVTVVNFGSGHSWGMMGMKVELANSGNFLMVADAIYMRDNVEPEISVPGIIHDSLGFIKSAKFILEYAKKHNCTLLYGHDIEQFRTLTLSTDGYYD